VKVLGGHVEELVETWTFQRKFGNVQRAATTTTDDTEQPPAFQNFVPGRRHNQAGQRYVHLLHCVLTWCVQPCSGHRYVHLLHCVLTWCVQPCSGHRYVHLLHAVVILCVQDSFVEPACRCHSCWLTLLLLQSASRTINFAALTPQCRTLAVMHCSRTVHHRPSLQYLHFGTDVLMMSLLSL